MPIIRRNNYTQLFHSTLHTRQSSIQNNKYKVSHKYSCFSWWWAHSRLKHAEKRNKHNKKNCAPSWLYLQGYTELYSQQNTKSVRLNSSGIRKVATLFGRDINYTDFTKHKAVHLWSTVLFGGRKRALSINVAVRVCVRVRVRARTSNWTSYACRHSADTGTTLLPDELFWWVQNCCNIACNVRVYTHS